jgi:uncharacterized protein YbjT (DUF2867 family)/uncharacterized membrane protein YphA (DoxX/SURF4 family)
MEPETRRSTVLVVGAQGFLGGYIAAGLRGHGYRVLCGVRTPRIDAAGERRCDLGTMTSPADWREALAGADAVVNVAGILREAGAQTFEAVHLRAPLALAHACIEHGVKRFVQISALGDPRDGKFIASKHRFDSALLALPLSAVVLRPSVVYAPDGSYGGTSLLRAMAALPFGIWVPGDGDWQLQPLSAKDLAEIVARSIDSTANGIFDVGGPAPISLREYQRQWRHWLRIDGDRVIKVPLPLTTPLAWVSERIGRGPLGTTMWRMLRRGNVVSPDASARIEETFGIAPHALDEVLSQHPSHVQDRWHARLYFLAPLLRFALVALWIVSGVTGLLTSSTEIREVVGSSIPHASALANFAACVDFVFAIWLATGWRMRWALAGMALSVVIYTIAFSLFSPAAWLAALGGLAKNLVILPALAVMWILGERR